MPNPFDWKKYYTLAEELKEWAENDQDEACLRSAVSRAYYSIFNQAQDYLTINHGVVFSRMGEGSHIQVWSKFQSTGLGRTGTAISERGFQLKSNREIADYHATTHKKLPSVMEETFILAKAVQSYLDQLITAQNK